MALLVGDVLGSWLDDCPELKMIATSIVPLGVEGEFCLEVGPMEPADAVDLYMERAHRASSGHTLNDEDEPAIQELVRRLDRSPLAIELAAARVRVLPPRTLLAKFEERFELLHSTAGGSQASLLEALTLTWELLPDEERTGLASLAVFEGGFTYEAAASLLEERSSRAQTLDLLDGLRSKSLLQVHDLERPRFQLFESVRDYALRVLAGSGLEEQTLRRHASFFVSKGEEALELVEGAQGQEASQWIKSERDNLVDVHHRFATTDSTLSARAGLILAPLLLMEGHGEAQEQLSVTTLTAARRSQAHRLQVQALLARGTFLKHQGRLEAGLQICREGQALAQAAGERGDEASFLVLAASLLGRMSRHEEARSKLERAERIAAEAGGLPLVEGMSLLTRGEMALMQYRPQEADSFFSRALELFRMHGLVRREGLASAAIGVAKQGLGRFREARRALSHAINASQQMENLPFEASTVGNLGCVELEAGSLHDAELHLQRSLTLHRELGSRLGEAIALVNLGILALEQGDLDLAESHFGASEGILVDFDNSGSRAELLAYIAVLESRRGRLQEAKRSLEDAKGKLPSHDLQGSSSKVGFVEGIIEIAEARSLASTSHEAADALVERARRRLAEAGAGPGPRRDFGAAFRLLEQEVAQWDAGLRQAGSKAASAALRVGPDADWFELPGSPRVRLSRRTAIRRVMDALVEQRLHAPGTPLDVQDLFDLGWPGENLHPDIALRRVYVGIAELRKLGLSEVLLHQTDGYLLAPKFPVVRQLD